MRYGQVRQQAVSTGTGESPLPVYNQYWSGSIPSPSLPPLLEWVHPLSQPTTSTGVGPSPLPAYHQYWSGSIPSPSLPPVLEWVHPLSQPTTSTEVLVRVSFGAGLLELERFAFYGACRQGFYPATLVFSFTTSPFIAEWFQSINTLLKKKLQPYQN